MEQGVIVVVRAHHNRLSWARDPHPVQPIRFCWQRGKPETRAGLWIHPWAVEMDGGEGKRICIDQRLKPEACRQTALVWVRHPEARKSWRCLHPFRSRSILIITAFFLFFLS